MRTVAEEARAAAAEAARGWAGHRLTRRSEERAEPVLRGADMRKRSKPAGPRSPSRRAAWRRPRARPRRRRAAAARTAATARRSSRAVVPLPRLLRGASAPLPSRGSNDPGGPSVIRRRSSPSPRSEPWRRRPLPRPRTTSPAARAATAPRTTYWPTIHGKIKKAHHGGRTFHGTRRSDELLGHHGSDRLFGRGRSDVLWGDWQGGADQPTNQRDRIYGGRGERLHLRLPRAQRDLRRRGQRRDLRALRPRFVDCGPGRDIYHVAQVAPEAATSSATARRSTTAARPSAAAG